MICRLASFKNKKKLKIELEHIDLKRMLEQEKNQSKING
jgi:hypothetical protein